MAFLPSDIRHSPLRQHFSNTGTAKKSYDTKELADLSVPKIQDWKGSKRRPYHSYMCDQCGKWHIGRKSAKGSKHVGS